jgi:hypothetical protein
MVDQGTVIIEASRSHSVKHTAFDRRVTSRSQRPLPDNTQHSHERQDLRAPRGFGAHNPSTWLLQTHALRLIHTYHAVRLPCPAAKGLDCVFHIWFTRCVCVWFTHATWRPCRAYAALMPHLCRAHAAPVPCHDHAVLKTTSQGHATARHGHGMVCVNWHRPSRYGMWATCPLSNSSDYHAKFHEGCYQKHTNLLNSRSSSSDISGYHADFHERHGTVEEWQGPGMACVY